jgi:methylated-DNA-[protein]-cysteine S-methyltransferase
VLLIAGDDAGICVVGFPRGSRARSPEPEWHRDDHFFKEAFAQLDAYFSGDLVTFELPLQLVGTAFQQAVWQALISIPFGETRSYGALAASIGRPSASRAVGAANGANPIAIVVPCHRVIGSDRSLTGFGGGLETKRFLLNHERQALGRDGAQELLPL